MPDNNKVIGLNQGYKQCFLIVKLTSILEIVGLIFIPHEVFYLSNMLGCVCIFTMCVMCVSVVVSVNDRSRVPQDASRSLRVCEEI
mgnify:CR=1 FL=1